MLSLLRGTCSCAQLERIAVLQRSFSVCTALLEKPMPPRMVIPEADIQESFLKGTGPGGQKINKTSSAVQLKHLPTGIVVKCQETRSRDQNRKTARKILGEKLEIMEKGPLSRTAIKTERAQKKKASADKKARRKYRKLDAEKAAGASIDEQQEAGAAVKSHLSERSTLRDASPSETRAAEENPR